MLRVTADTNVLVSGIVYPRGNPRQFLNLALASVINVTVSQPIIDEMADVLERKFGATVEDVARAKAVIKQAARTVQPAVHLEVIKEDPADNRILECAVSAGADYVVTGDKDLLRIGVYSGIRILNVSDFLDIAAGQARER